MSLDQTLAVIEAYRVAAETMLLRLKQSLNVTVPLLHAHKAGLIPKEATVDGISYWIHGGGIYLSEGKLELDIELGPGDFAKAFDAWRLFTFRPQTASQTASLEEFRHNLSLLAATGMIIPYPYLSGDFFTLQ